MSKSRGAVLIISLVLLFALSLLGATAMNSAAQSEHIASNTRQGNLAFQAAEAALRFAEASLSTQTPMVRSSVPTITGDITTYWLTTYIWTTAAGANPVTLDTTLLGVQPYYVIDDMGPTGGAGGGSLQAGQPIGSGLPAPNLYRITARGTGGTVDAVAIVQSLYLH